MRILVVHSDDIRRFPPVRNLLECLLKNKHEVTIITKDENATLQKWKYNNLKVELLKSYTSQNKYAITKVYFENRNFLRKKVSELMNQHDIIWTTTDIAVREIGEQLLNYMHIMQLMELIETIPGNTYLKFIKFDITKYARNAISVIVPEINRAYITKTWWKLDKTPIILPNKPYSLSIPDIPEDIKPYIEMMEKETRKIVLYQGVFYKDRNLKPVAKAINELKETYCMYVMGRDSDIRKELCEEYPEVKYIPFFDPPYHLLITQRANVGLLPYVPSNSYHFSVLNALYCAPNKIFEYAAFGLPMIGSDVPGLLIPFKMYNMGFCYKEGSAEEIKSLLNEINDNYDVMSESSKKYYSSVDFDEIVDSILKKVKLDNED